MVFWIIAALMALVTLAAILLPLLRDTDAGEQSDTAPEEVAIYRDQLAEVERDLARGLLDPADAERTRTEIARRILTADRDLRETTRPAPRRMTLIVGALAGILLIGGAFGFYLTVGAPGYPDLPRQTRIANSDAARDARPSQIAAEQALNAERIADLPEEDAEATALIAQLRDIVPTRPDDLQGWELLAQYEAAMGNRAAALRAEQELLIREKGDEATIADHAALADYMVAAADGFVSPEAEELLRMILSQDPENNAGRYYMGLLYAQTDRPDLAFRLWRPVVETADGSVHVRLARAQIEDIAFRAGARYTLPPEGAGPSIADIAAAEEMEPEAREEMIRGMVDSLSNRLATTGGTAQDWARLIGAYGVLGEDALALSIWLEAREVFGTDAEALALVQAAAQQAGLVQ